MNGSRRRRGGDAERRAMQGRVASTPRRRRGTTTAKRSRGSTARAKTERRPRRHDWVAIVDTDELIFRNGTGALDDACPADAPIVAGLRTSLAGRESKTGRVAAASTHNVCSPRSLGDAYDHTTSACLAPFVFASRRESRGRADTRRVFAAAAARSRPRGRTTA